MQDHKLHSHKGEVLIYFPVLFQLTFPLLGGIKLTELYYIHLTLVSYQTEYQWNTSTELST